MRIGLEFKRVIQSHFALGRLRLGHEVAGIQCGSTNADVAKWQKRRDLKSVRVKPRCGFDSRHWQALPSSTWQLHALRISHAVLRVVTPFQLLEAHIIFFAVISHWPIFESTVRIVCVMAGDLGLRNINAHPTYCLLKYRRVRGRSSICLGLAQVRKSAVRIGSAIVLNGRRATAKLRELKWREIGPIECDFANQSASLGLLTKAKHV